MSLSPLDPPLDHMHQRLNLLVSSAKRNNKQLRHPSICAASVALESYPSLKRFGGIRLRNAL